MIVRMRSIKRYSTNHLSYKHFLFPYSAGMTLFKKSLKRHKDEAQIGSDIKC